MKRFFAKLHHMFICFMCFLLMTCMILLPTLPSQDGTSTLPGFAAFLLWLVLLFVLIKGHPVLSAVLSVVIAIGLAINKNGIESVFTEDMTQLIGCTVVLGLIIFMFKGSHDSDVAYSNKLKSRVCPKCGGQLVFVPERHIVTKYETVEKGGHWEYDYSDSQTKSYWVKDMAQVPEYETIRAHYECTNCSFKS